MMSSNYPTHILIIDDDEINNFIVEKLIHRLSPDSEVTACMNGREALEFLKNSVHEEKNFPDYIFLDLRMPVLDGWGFLDEYEKRGFRDRGSVVILTSSIYRYDIDRAHNHLVPTHFISKPLTLEHLKKILCA